MSLPATITPAFDALTARVDALETEVRAQQSADRATIALLHAELARTRQEVTARTGLADYWLKRAKEREVALERWWALRKTVETLAERTLEQAEAELPAEVRRTLLALQGVAREVPELDAAWRAITEAEDAAGL